MRSNLFPVLLATLVASPLAAQVPRFELRRELWPDPTWMPLEVVDLTGDSVPDLLRWKPSGLEVVEGLPGGRFGDVLSSHPIFTNLGESVLFDKEGDGDLDLLLTNRELCGQGTCGCAVHRVVLLENDGAGHFQDVSTSLPASPGGPYSFARAGDVDADGDLDLVLAGVHVSYANIGQPIQHCLTSSALWRNDGTGTFTTGAAPILPFAPAIQSECLDLVLADLDGDQAVEILYGSEFAGIQYLSNDGTGGFTSTPARLVGPSAVAARQMLAIDVDGDADLDLVTTPPSNSAPGAASLYLNDGAGTLTHAGAPGGAAGEVFGAGDFDADGDVDFVFFGYETTEQVENVGGTLVSLGPLALATTLFDPVHAMAPDLDGDGDADLVASDLYLDRSSTLQFRSDGAGGLDLVAEAHPLPFSPGGFGALDLDGDGDLDVPIGGYRPGVLLNDGGGTFTLDPGGTLGGTTLAFDGELRDFDGDGDQDLATREVVTGDRVRVHFQAGGTFASTTTVPFSGSASGITATDLDQDGDQDLLLLQWFPTLVDARLNDGAGNFTVSGTPQSLGSDYPGDVLAGDFDGDGDPDLVTKQRLFRNTAGTFTQVGPLFWTVNNDARGFDVGDLDLDGDLDVMLGTIDASNDATMPPNVLLLNDGTGALVDASGQLGPGYSNTFLLDLVDLDEDGDLDALWTDDSWHLGTTVMRNDGTATFTEAPGTIPPYVTAGVGQFFDVDGDGDRDYYTGRHEMLVLHRADRSFYRTTVPSIGKPLAFEVEGPASGGYLVAWSPNRVQVALPSLASTLWLDPGALFVESAGPLDPNGLAEPATSLPADATLVGRTFYTQAATLPPLRLSNLETLTVTDL